MTELKQRILPSVQKPARYTGGEWGEIKKNIQENTKMFNVHEYTGYGGKQ